jgi:glycosyltransferase involved in cell wall biosynthesis
MGKPAVASRLPLVERTFPTGSVTTYAPGDPASLATALLAIVDDRQARDAAVARTSERIRELSWEHEADRLAALVELVAPDRLSSSR